MSADENFRSPAFEIVVIGASRGGYQALQTLISALPDSFPVPVCIVQHIGRLESALPQLLQSRTRLRVRYAEDGDTPSAGHVYVAPPDHHLLVKEKRLRLSSGAKENFTRPAIDPLFRTAAFAYRERALGIVLTGELSDGTVGLQAIKACGGLAMVQDPQEATAPSMPQSALEHVRVDYCLPLVHMARTLLTLARGLARPMVESIPQSASVESAINLTQANTMAALNPIGHASPISCLECNGVQWELNTAGTLRYRCHTGQAFTAQTLSLAQNEQQEEAIWSAIRALHEKKHLLGRLASNARENNRGLLAHDYEQSAVAAEAHAKTLQELVSKL